MTDSGDRSDVLRALIADIKAGVSEAVNCRKARNLGCDCRVGAEIALQQLDRLTSLLGEQTESMGLSGYLMVGPRNEHRRGFVVQLSQNEIELICEGLMQREMWGTGERLCERFEALLAKPRTAPGQDDRETPAQKKKR